MILHLIRPWWLLALIPSVLWCLLLWKRQQQQSGWQQYCDAHLLEHVVVNNPAKQSKLWLLLLALALLSMVVGLSGPSWHRLVTPVYKKSIARVIALDLSDSMLANDLAPNRLQRAKYKVLDLLNAIDEGQTGMVVFSRQAFVVSPLTDDSNTIASMVPTLNTDTVPVQGSRISTALDKSMQLLQQAGAENGSVILVTDSMPSPAALSAAKKLVSNGYRVLVLGVGTSKGSPIPNANGGFMTNKQGEIIFAKLNVAALQQLANAGNGEYVSMTTNDSDVKTLLADSDQRDTEKREQSEQQKVLWQDQGHWFIWFALVMLVLLVRRGWLEHVV